MVTRSLAWTWAVIALALAVAGDARAEKKPERLWMWGSVERPPPRVKPGQRVFFHGDREVSISEFVRIAGYDELADRMERRQLRRVFLPNFRPAYHNLRKMEQEYNRRLTVTQLRF